MATGVPAGHDHSGCKAQGNRETPKGTGQKRLEAGVERVAWRVQEREGRGEAEDQTEEETRGRQWDDGTHP